MLMTVVYVFAAPGTSGDLQTPKWTRESTVQSPRASLNTSLASHPFWSTRDQWVYLTVIYPKKKFFLDVFFLPCLDVSALFRVVLLWVFSAAQRGREKAKVSSAPSLSDCAEQTAAVITV